jgi:probable HAF family extracellular repeat protein
VVGSSGDRAVLYDNGVTTELHPLPHGRFAAAHGINDRGQVVGLSDTGEVGGDIFPEPISRAVLWDGAAVRDLGTPLPGWSSDALDVNDRGQVVGVGISGGGAISYEPFLYDPAAGGMRYLGHLPGFGDDDFSEGRANAINDRGQVVGSSNAVIQDEERTITSHAFLYENGRMLDLNGLIPADAGWELGDASDINDRGWVIASGTPAGDPFGPTRGFLLTPTGGPGPIPIPLPPAAWSGLTVAGGLMLASRRRSAPRLVR